MNIFLTGASGYIGGTVAVRLIAAGHRVRGLVRSAAKAEAVRRLGLDPVTGTLDDAELLAREAKRADAVINAADSDHRAAAETLVKALAGTNKTLLHTSGSSIVADTAAGEASDRVYDDSIYEAGSGWAPVPDKAARVAIDRLILSLQDARGIVLCPCLIYGRGLGADPDSIQLPTLAEQARKTGVARHVGNGRNIWSTVHIEDVADAYVMALAKAPPASFLFVENGEANFRDMVGAIARAQHLASPQPWPIDDAIRELGHGRAMYSLASNSRVRATRLRALGWAPRHASVLAWIETAFQPVPA
jgi:nucleoside-diphosphate-sugar epimerase